MTEEIKTTTPEKPEAPAPEKVTAPIAPTSSGKTVTASKSVSFPSLNWGITAGEERELPADPAAQEVILSNIHITLKK